MTRGRAGPGWRGGDSSRTGPGDYYNARTQAVDSKSASSGLPPDDGGQLFCGPRGQQDPGPDGPGAARRLAVAGRDRTATAGQILARKRAILYFEARADASGQGRGAGVSFRLAITPPSTNLATGFSQTGRPHGWDHPYSQERAWGNRIPAFLSVECYTHIAYRLIWSLTW